MPDGRWGVKSDLRDIQLTAIPGCQLSLLLLGLWESEQKGYSWNQGDSTANNINTEESFKNRPIVLGQQNRCILVSTKPPCQSLSKMRKVGSKASCHVYV